MTDNRMAQTWCNLGWTFTYILSKHAWDRGF